MTNGLLPVRTKIRLVEITAKSKDPHLFLEVDFETAKGAFWCAVELLAYPRDLEELDRTLRSFEERLQSCQHSGAL